MDAAQLRASPSVNVQPRCRKAVAADPAPEHGACRRACHAAACARRGGLRHAVRHALADALRPLLALVLCVLLGLAASLAAAAPSRSLAFQNLGALGPGSQSIIAIQQDAQGFIWIGTIEGGLYRYDGSDSIKYVNDPNNVRSLPGGRVAALFSDAKGQLWVGTDEGLARFDPKSNDFIRYAPNAGQSKNHIVRRIVDDGHGGMWLATWGGLQHFDPASGRFLAYKNTPTSPDSLAANDINALAVDAVGGVWAGTWPGGLDYLAPGASRFLHFRVDSPDQADSKLNDVRSLLVDRRGALWMGTDAGIVVWQAGTPWTARKRLDGVPSRIANIDEDSAGEIWFSSRTRGLMRWRPTTQQLDAYLHREADPRSLPSDAINVSMRDRTGTLWVGSMTDGISRANLGYEGFERMIPRTLAPQIFHSSNFVRSIAGAPHNRLWIGTNDGLVLFDPALQQVVHAYAAKTGQAGALSDNAISALYQSADGPLWIGTLRGLNRLDHPGAAVEVIHFGKTSNDFINSIAPGRQGILWLGTGGNLIRYDTRDGTSRSFVHNPRSPENRCVDDASTVLEDSKGRLWVGGGARGGGLDLLDQISGKFQHFRHDPASKTGLSSDHVTALFEDSRGTLWVGTTRGLNKRVMLADGAIEFQAVQENAALGLMPIESIREDTAGMIWVSTVNGLSKLDPMNANISNYSAEDGLTEGFYIGASAIDSSGRLYFGGTGGITAVNPAAPAGTSYPPQTAIADIRIFNRSLRLGPSPAGVTLDGNVSDPHALTLPWDASVLSIEFAALHFADPKRNRYAYWLEGFDQRPVHADAAHPVATYTNLAPGTYEFHLVAINNKGIAGASEVRLPITVRPPFWLSLWFRALAAVAIWVALVAIHRWRVRRLTVLARELEATVKARTCELEASIQALATLSTTDALTGIANRRCFDETLTREWRRAARSGELLALLLLDVDVFKLYNDCYGHQAGDECLRQVAQLMAGAVHRSSDLVARYGGEEFVIIAPMADAAAALRMAQGICLRFAELALPHQQSPFDHVTVSIGVAAVVPRADQTAAVLIEAADLALYQAKTTGRNRAVLAQSLHGSAS